MRVPDIRCYRFIYVWHFISKTCHKIIWLYFSKFVLIPSLLRAMNLQCLSFYSRSWPRSVDSCCPALVWNCRTWRSSPRVCSTVKRGVDETAKENGIRKISKSVSKETVLCLFYNQFANLSMWYHFRRAL